MTLTILTISVGKNKIHDIYMCVWASTLLLLIYNKMKLLRDTLKNIVNNIKVWAQHRHNKY